MSKQKKPNIVSLLIYRKKKQKLNLKKTGKKAASDEDVFFTDHKESFDNSSEDDEGVKEGKVYYMPNYLKKKHLSRLTEQNTSKKKQKDLPENKPLQNYKKIINLSKYRKKSQHSSTAVNRKKISFFKDSKAISLEDYRKNKVLQEKDEAKVWPFPKRAVKETLSFTAMVFMMLFVLNIFLKNEQTNTAERGIASVERASGLHSFFKEWSLKDSFSSTQYIKKIKSEEFKDQEAITGKKPDSSTYEGF